MANTNGNFPPDSIDLNGKRVAVLGTGSSAIQVIPEVQKGTLRLDNSRVEQAFLTSPLFSL